MLRYIVRRILSVIPVLIGISVMAFMLGLLTPGDPAAMALGRDGVSQVTPELLEAKREELGLNDPGAVQYLRWAGKVLQGDLGRSYSDHSQVSGELLRRLPMTLKLACSGMALVCVFGISFGIFSAAFVNRAPDQGMKFLTNVMTLPVYRGVSMVFCLLCCLFLIYDYIRVFRLRGDNEYSDPIGIKEMYPESLGLLAFPPLAVLSEGALWWNPSICTIVFAVLLSVNTVLRYLFRFHPAIKGDEHERRGYLRYWRRHNFEDEII